MIKEKIKNLIIVFLISLPPFLNFTSKNIGHLYIFDFLYLFIYFSIFFTIVYFFTFFIYKFFHKMPIHFLIGYMIIIFFSYGFIFNLVEKMNFDIFFNKRVFSLILWFILILITFRFGKNFIHNEIYKRFSLFFFIFLNVSLLIFTFIGFFQIERQTLRSNQYKNENLNLQFINNLEIKPNVYYLVLDHYPRADLLKEIYNYDNSNFLNEIKRMDYKVADKSTTNVIGTDANMTIVFDMNTKYFKKYLGDKKDFYIGDWLKGNTAVNNIFRKIGYKNFVSLDSSLQGAPCNKFNLKDTGYDKCISQKIKLAELEINFLKSTPIIDLLGKFFPTFFAYQYLYLDTITSKLDNLVKYNNEGFFLYIHLLMPHPPPKFNKNCKKKIDVFEINIKDKFLSSIAKKSFIEDLKCINYDVLEFAKKINIIDSNAIVVIQSDNAIPTLEFPLAYHNINFWKLPSSCENMFMDDISNVNTFRIIFNCIGVGNWQLEKNELIKNY